MKKSLVLPPLPPQKNVKTLEEGMEWTRNWRETIAPLFNHDETQIPHAIFIPFEDIAELQKLAGLLHSAGDIAESPIYMVGVRAYFSLTNKDPQSGVIEGNRLKAVLVPVYQTNPREPGAAGEFDYNFEFRTYDLVVPVPSADDITAKANQTNRQEETYTIYDITQPCPNLCDPESELFGALPLNKKK